jgi:hypothetical protein
LNPQYEVASLTRCSARSVLLPLLLLLLSRYSAKALLTKLGQSASQRTGFSDFKPTQASASDGVIAARASQIFT